MPHSIKHFLTINTPPEVVYDAITTKTGIQAWWTTNTVIEPKKGSIAEFIFGDRYHNKMEITDLQKNKRVEWKCIQGDDQWIGTAFVFELEEKDGQTNLRFSHNNWEEVTDFFAHCNFQWGKYLRSLKSLCETGKGNPYQDS